MTSKDDLKMMGKKLNPMILVKLRLTPGRLGQAGYPFLYKKIYHTCSYA